MSHSKASKARYELAKQARESALTMARSSAPIIRDTLEAMANDQYISTDQPSTEAIMDVQAQIVARGPSFLASLPMWTRVPCPSWFTRRTVAEDASIIEYRDTKGWDQQQRAALAAILKGDYTPRKRSDGSLERYIAPPCNAARLLSLISVGNAQDVIDCSTQVVKSASIKKDSPIHDIYEDVGTTQDVDSVAHAIMIAAADLNRKDSSYRKAQAEYNNLMGTTTIRNGKPIGDAERLTRLDNATTARKDAMAAFNRAWAKRHTMSKEDMTPAVESAPVVSNKPLVVTPSASEGLLEAVKAQDAVLFDREEVTI